MYAVAPDEATHATLTIEPFRVPAMPAGGAGGAAHDSAPIVNVAGAEGRLDSAPSDDTRTEKTPRVCAGIGRVS